VTPLARDPVRVLLVEDEADSARLLTRRLTRYPGARFEVSHSWNLRSAFERLEAERFDVMVLDLCLPDGDGFGTLVKACAVARDLPIVVLTAEDDDEMSLRAIRAGAQDYLIKPLTDVRPVARALLHAQERHRQKLAVAVPSQEVCA